MGVFSRSQSRSTKPFQRATERLRGPLNKAKSQRLRAKDGSGGKEEMERQRNVYFKRLEWERYQVFVWIRGGEKTSRACEASTADGECASGGVPNVNRSIYSLCRAFQGQCED